MKKALIAVGLLIVGVNAYAIFSVLRGMGIPPGCKRSISMGGCFGKNINRNFKISRALPSCLTIRSHECNHARIEVQNACANGVTASIQGIPITQAYGYLYFLNDDSGNPVLQGKDDYEYPATDQDIRLEGLMNGEKYTVSYTVTKKMCE